MMVDFLCVEFVLEKYFEVRVHKKVFDLEFKLVFDFLVMNYCDA